MSYINYFNFSLFGKEEYLITNDAGRYLFLNEVELKALIEGNFEEQDGLNERLEENLFATTGNKEIFIDKVAGAVRDYKDNLFDGPSLHIFVLTTKCNQRCIYCQASVKEDGHMMNKEIAKKSVDLALQSPSNFLSFEFQGGEPLLNYEVLKYIVEYTESLEHKKEIQFNLVSNLSLMTEEMMQFFIDHKVSISTSIDGPEDLHMKNRPFRDGKNFKVVTENISRLRSMGMQNIGAIQTTTKQSFEQYKEIVQQYIECGMNNVFIRPLTPLGFAEKSWDKIGYTPEEFINFYRKILDYIVELALQGVDIMEGHAMIFLRKILGHQAGNYTELCSPCGAVRSQLAYYCNGNIYTCDEGRMMAEMGNEAFKVGTVDDSYQDIVGGSVCKTMCVASCLEAIPSCEQCVYNPYCGTCPVINLAMYESIFVGTPKDYKCRIYKGILDILFEYLQENNSEKMMIFKRWACVD